MAHKRQWLIVVIGPLYLGLFIFADRIAAVGIRSVGINTIRLHPVRVSMLTIGIGVVLGLLFAAFAWLDQKRMAQSRFFAIVGILLGCFGLYIFRGEVPDLIFYLQHEALSSLPEPIATSFMLGAIFSYSLFSGIFSLATMRRNA
ncbi:MAG TPA: hypothetical protein VGL77_20570 [Armatimonadota bacterium]|jgi:hypothetical protein